MISAGRRVRPMISAGRKSSANDFGRPEEFDYSLRLVAIVDIVKFLDFDMKLNKSFRYCKRVFLHGQNSSANDFGRPEEFGQ